MKKPMKKYVNGILNQNYKSVNNKTKIFEKNSYNDELINMISEKTEEKKIYDSRLNSSNEKSSKDLRNDINEKVERAKELLGIRKTDNKKNDSLEGYKLDYKKKHELRNYKENDALNIKNINYEDIFKDL